MQKRERLERTIAGEMTDRTPVMLYRHWPGDDLRAADLARALFAFQADFDWDFVVASAGNFFSVLDYGLTADWQGNLDGFYTATRHIIQRSLEWTDLRPLDPERGLLGRQIECIRLLANAFDADDTPYIQLVYSPFAQAVQLAGLQQVIRHMRTHPDRLRSGFNVLSESTLTFLEILQRTGVAGIYYVAGHADYAVMSEDEYVRFAMPYDQKILDSLPQKWWLNVLSARGTAPMLNLLSQYPVTVLQWEDRAGHPALERGKMLFSGAVCGGLAAEGDIHMGTPSTVRDAGRDALRQTDGRRLILSAGTQIKITSPRSNIQSVRDVVDPGAAS